MQLKLFLNKKTKVTHRNGHTQELHNTPQPNPTEVSWLLGGVLLTLVGFGWGVLCVAQTSYSVVEQNTKTALRGRP